MNDLILYNCRIFGKDESLDTIAIRNGIVSRVSKSMEGMNGKKIDLEGKTVVPGFIDSHAHLMSLGLSMNRLDLSQEKTRQDTLEAARRYSESARNEVLVGYGWDETFWGEKEYLASDELDFTDRPMILFRKDMHMATINTAALRISGITAKNGIVKEENLRNLDHLTNPDMAEIRKAMISAIQRAASEGITTVRDISLPEVPEAISGMSLPVRVISIIYDRSFDSQKDGTERIWGSKVFLDGSIGSLSAAHEGWPEENLKFTDSALAAHIGSFIQKGVPVAMHAIGEKAVKQAVSALKEQGKSLRNSIEHFELVDQDTLSDVGGNTVVSSQPNFLQWSLKGGLYEDRLGKEWFGRDNPFREIIEAGIHLAFGSDTMPIGPSYGISLAVNTPHRRQRITMDEAVTAYTAGGAYVIGEEKFNGRIEEGYRADLAVFDDQYLQDASVIGEKKALMTILGGQIVYRAQGGIS